MLVERRRGLERERRAAERAAARSERIRAHLRVIDDALCEETAPWVDSLRVARPCKAHWEDMAGDDAVRRCTACDREVYDLTAMTTAEIGSLHARASTSPCVRLARRADGRVVTADCPPEEQPVHGWGRRWLGAGAAVGVGAVAIALLTMPVFRVSLGGVSARDRYVLSRWTEMEGRMRELEVAVAAATPEPPSTPSAATNIGASSRPRTDLDVRAIEHAMGATTSAPAPIALPTTAEDIARHVRVIDDRTWEIDRSLVDALLAESAPLRHPVRLVPVADDGHVTGVKLYGIRPGSLLAKLGLRNGDIIRSIDGYDLATPDRALDAYSRIGDATTHAILLERAHRPRLHVILIDPDR
jgi:hypothetical protein